MKLQDAINGYVQWRRFEGVKYESGESLLRQFAKGFSTNCGCDQITEHDARKFVVGNGTLTRARANRYTVLSSFFRYSVTRGHITQSPMPPRHSEPKSPDSMPPHIYTQDEIKRLLSKIESTRQGSVRLNPFTFRMLILLLYGCGVRIGEALQITLNDVNTEEAVVCVGNAKFFKSRLIPISRQLNDLVKQYLQQRTRWAMAEGSGSAFLAGLDGAPLAYATIQEAFAKLLLAADVHEPDPARRPPSIHGLRHAFAIHRLTAAYRNSEDLQRILPALSTYLGHSHVSGTQVYLSMTSELLQQASVKFDRYINGESDE